MAVLIVTGDKPLVRDGIEVYPGGSGAAGGSGHYVDLLSASNMRWDVVAPVDIARSTFISDNTVKYAAVIFAVPLASLSDEQMGTLQDVSFEQGISIMATYDFPDERSRKYFGIRSFKGRKLLWPLKARIFNWPDSGREPEVTADFGLRAGLPGLRKRGFRKLSFRRTFAKGTALLKSLSMRYMAADPDPGAQVMATTMAGRPIAWSHRFGQATNYYFALDNRSLLSRFNQMHRLVRSALLANSGYGMASMCLKKTMVVRLDDPGACKTDHLDTGKLLEETDWEELAASLESHQIPLSVMYTPGWVDDGDCRGGELYLNGTKAVERKAGIVHDSAGVTYVSLRGSQERYDHSSEYRGLKRLLERSCIDIHSHGLTHLDTEHQNWSTARDKGTDSTWYHEFFHVRESSPVKEELQLHALTASKEKIEELFQVSPYAFTPSGHMHDADCDILAHKAGYSLFSSDYTGIAKDNLLIRNKRMVAVFLCFKEPTDFAGASGYPVIGVIHDYEIKNNVAGLIDTVNKWKQKGIERFLTLKDLTASLCATIDARYCASQSNIVLDISYSDRLINHRRHFTLAGALVTLQVSMPVDAESSEADISTSNGKVVSVVRKPGEITFSLELKEALSYRIEIQVVQKTATRSVGSGGGDPPLKT